MGVKTTGSAAPLVVTQLAASEAHANEVKMPVGRSSRTSSVGEDSGLGQISPSGGVPLIFMHVAKLSFLPKKKCASPI